MSVRAATAELIGQQVRAVLEQRPDAQAIALRAEPRWIDGAIVVDDRRVLVEPCGSPLAVRATLADRQGDDLLVVLCDLADADLGADVLARFTPARVLGLEPWSAVRDLFGVRHLDAAFGKGDAWIADALLTHVSRAAARTMTGGAVLTMDVALDAVAGAVLGAPHLDVDSILEAAADLQPFVQLSAVDATVRAGLLDALRRRGGALGEVVASALAEDRGAELVPIGLVARAVYGTGDLDGGRAGGRLEARCGVARLAPSVGAALATRAEAVVDKLFTTDRDRANDFLAAAAALSAEIGATHPETSDFLGAGFEQRIASAAALIVATLDSQSTATGTDLEDAVDRVADHRLRGTPGGRTRHDHLEMAARLAMWVTTPTSEAASFEEAVTEYAASSAWVDRARRRLWHGDRDTRVGAAYKRLLDAVAARRRVENQRFAQLLATWTMAPASADVRAAAGVVPVEDVAATVLAPLGSSSPVLFVVLDGCGLPSFIELAPQLSEVGYREVVPTSGSARRQIGVAALPTVTEVSRASLLAGQLDQGNQEHERRAFARNTSLRIAGTDAALFHQNRLLGAAGSQLAADVETALGASGPTVVGVVINTIDDQLKRGTFADELRLEDLHALVTLLDTARTHGRTVVISADHGHVLAQPDDGGTGAFQGGGSGGERWREADREPKDNEVVLRGERVLLGGAAGVLAPFDDDFRYGAKAGGYHGGATPEEVLVPVAAFVPAGIDLPEGWEHGPQVSPLWWDLRLGTTLAEAAEVVAPKPRPRKQKLVPEAQGAMFEVPVVVPAPAPTSADGPTWLGPLLASEVWKLQREAAARAQLPDDRVRSVLKALDRRGNVASVAALAADSGIPSTRLPGFLAVLARVLNVDGYAVLDVDATAGEVRLSVPLLVQQFELSGTA
ncbi:MAG TPA: BREX-2 system phosphatase PglZ [Acidimicrobiales bacterium]|nr:BREX-2 system phosphatase PglZ [Acidimicrobiales bacterium]